MSASMERLTPWKLFTLADKMQFSIRYWENERILQRTTAVLPPPPGSEIRIKNLPTTIYEDAIVHHFMELDDVFIYKTRLLITPDGLGNVGTAYITFASPNQAKLALSLNNSEIYPGHKIIVEMSLGNKRLFVGGIPVHVNKEEILKELIKTGFENICEVILYQSYADLNKNRGYVFVDFLNHESAESARLKFKHCPLFGERVQIGWSKPIPEIPESEMKKVKILFIRNLSVFELKKVLVEILENTLRDSFKSIEKIYRFRDYAFVHFVTRQDAEAAMDMLKGYYKSVNSTVEVEWAKPPPKANEENKENKSVSFNGINNAACTLSNPVVDSVIVSTVPRTFGFSLQENVYNMFNCAPVFPNYNFPQNNGFQG